MSTQTETKSNQEFLIEVVKACVDFNSQVLSVLAVELAGDQSGKNRTHQKKVLTDIQNLGNSYNYTLNKMFDDRERELKPVGAGSEFNEETRKALKKTIGVLDAKMMKEPNQELAAASNYIQLMLDNDTVPAEEKAE